MFARYTQPPTGAREILRVRADAYHAACHFSRRKLRVLRTYICLSLLHPDGVDARRAISHVRPSRPGSFTGWQDRVKKPRGATTKGRRRSSLHVGINENDGTSGPDPGQYCEATGTRHYFLRSYAVAASGGTVGKLDELMWLRRHRERGLADALRWEVGVRYGLTGGGSRSVWGTIIVAVMEHGKAPDSAALLHTGFHFHCFPVENGHTLALDMCSILLREIADRATASPVMYDPDDRRLVVSLRFWLIEVVNESLAFAAKIDH
ncbi:hypothetical protein EDB83DRAFT_2551601 [Lactarius deliciosus]|nr:hypothetical protein EDB83DRAFT_2551601 [Lactarius deliciosus]